MNSYLSGETEKVIADFLPVLNRMDGRKCNDLISGILRMKDSGVEAFAHRRIYKNGYSSMFCTSSNWAKIDKTDRFKTDFVNHISPEIVKAYQNRNSIVSRSKDKVSDSFLQSLENAGVNNSIILHEFHKDHVDVIYFMAKPDSPDDRDLILNNIEGLNFIRKGIGSGLQEILNSQEFKNKKEKILTPSAIRAIWASREQQEREIKLFCDRGNYTNVTYRELECLAYLRLGTSNKIIAEHLQISVDTVKHHISNLKTKLLVNDRSDLIRIAQEPKIQNISKIIGPL